MQGQAWLAVVRYRLLDVACMGIPRGVPHYASQVEAVRRSAGRRRRSAGRVAQPPIHPGHVLQQPALQGGHLCGRAGAKRMHVCVCGCARSESCQAAAEAGRSACISPPMLPGPTCRPLLLGAGVPGLQQHLLVALEVAQHCGLDLQGHKGAGRRRRGSPGGCTRGRQHTPRGMLLNRPTLGPGCTRAALSAIIFCRAASDQGPERSCAQRAAAAEEKRASDHMRLRRVPGCRQAGAKARRGDQHF